MLYTNELRSHVEQRPQGRFTSCHINKIVRSRRGRDRMVVRFTTTYMQPVPITTKVVHEFKSNWWRGVFDTTLCDKVCQWHLVTLCHLVVYMYVTCLHWRHFLYEMDIWLKTRSSRKRKAGQSCASCMYFHIQRVHRKKILKCTMTSSSSSPV
jgi:hypothetical protein